MLSAVSVNLGERSPNAPYIEDPCKLSGDLSLAFPCGHKKFRPIFEHLLTLPDLLFVLGIFCAALLGKGVDSSFSKGSDDDVMHDCGGPMFDGFFAQFFNFLAAFSNVIKKPKRFSPRKTHLISECLSICWSFGRCMTHVFTLTNTPIGE